ncbi:MAG: hypothetical protein V1688_01485, partial [bacterium]
MGGQIKGVTSGFTRDFGEKSGLLTSKGYSNALKKVSGTNNARKLFKESGLKTKRFSTSQAIKKEDFFKDLKEAKKVGIIKNIETARNKYREMAKREELNLERKEGSIFNSLSKAAKHKLIWGSGNNIVSAGAKIAAERQKVRDQNLRKAGDVGIAGFQTLEKQGDSTLWRRYKILKDAPHKNTMAIRKLKEISSDIDLIKLKAKRNPLVLHRYGIPETQKEKS